jgi:hypothetical protein
MVRKFVTAATIGAAALAGSVVSAQPAEAARMDYWYHSGASQSASVLVYYNFNCTGSGWDWVHRGTEAQVDVGSMKLARGKSLWRIDSRGRIVKIFDDKSYTRCVSFVGRPEIKGWYAVRDGNNWGTG